MTGSIQRCISLRLVLKSLANAGGQVAHVREPGRKHQDLLGHRIDGQGKHRDDREAARRNILEVNGSQEGKGSPWAPACILEDLEVAERPGSAPEVPPFQLAQAPGYGDHEGGLPNRR